MAKAILLLSGGLDSATCLAIALNSPEIEKVIAISFDYGQKHSPELLQAKKLAASYGSQKVEHRIINLDLGQWRGSALTQTGIDVPDYQLAEENEIPVTYVPARNLVFLSIAVAIAEAEQAKAVIIGANAVDYSGYPDCRPEFMQSFAQTADLGTKVGVQGGKIEIQTPLIMLKKSEIIRIGLELGVDYSKTVSCYRANSDGLACGLCDSCHFRKLGFEQAGVLDPTRYFKG